MNITKSTSMNKFILSLYFLIFLIFNTNNLSAQSVVTLVDSDETLFRDDIIFDDSGNLYCADYGGTNVYKRTPDGVVSIFISGLDTPNGLAFDSSNNLFVCDNVASRIYKVSSLGSFLDTFYVSNPSGLIKELDSDTMIFTNYGGSHELSKLAPDGTVIPTHSGMGLNGPVGLEFDSSGQLYVANFTDRKIFKVFDDTLLLWATVPGPPSGALGFLAYGGGYLWATSWHDHKIYGVSTTSMDSTFVLAGSTSGSSDGPISTAKIRSPNGILSNHTGDTIYFTEYNTGKLRMIRPDFAGIESELSAEHEKMLVFPNPVESMSPVHISKEVSLDHVVVFDSKGSRVADFEVDQENSELILKSKGIYIIHLVEGEDVFRVKLVVQ